MKASDRARFRRRLVRANASLTRTLERAMRREFQISATEAAAAVFDVSIHRERLEMILARWYRATAAQFGAIGADMLATGATRRQIRETTPDEVPAAVDRRAMVESILRAIVATAVAAAFVAVVVRALMERPAVVATVDAAIQAANGDVFAATAAVSRDPAVVAAVADAIVSAIPAAPPVATPQPPPAPPPIDPPVEPPAPPPSGGGREEFLARVERYVREFAPDRARKISATSQQAVTDALAQAAREGLGEENAARLVLDALGGSASLRRARTIARTEVGGAQNAALIFEADGSRRRVRKTWAAIDDARTRPAHVAADGQTIDPGENFLVGGEFLAHPGDPNGSPRNIINCRCTILLEPIE